jgi:hypothetical protein
LNNCIQYDRFDITYLAFAQPANLRVECKRNVGRVAISLCISETGRRSVRTEL